MRATFNRLLILSLSTLILTLMHSAVSAQSSKQVITGNIFYMGGPSGSINTTFSITINSLSSSQEVQQILDDLQNGGQDKLVKSLGKEKKGTIQIGTQLGHDINAAWVSNEEEGRKLTILFERWMGFGELRRGSRSVDYPFTYLEIYLDDKGPGEGSLFPAAKVRSKGGKTIEVENFGIYPARLTNIKQEH